MSTPQPNEGAQAEASVQVSMALDLLEKAIPAFGSESPEGGAIVKALQTLSKPFGAKREGSQQMIPAELRMMMQTLGMKTPETQAAAGAGGAPGAGMQPQAA